MSCATHREICPQETDGLNIIQKAFEDHAQSHVVDRLLYTQYTSERNEFRNCW